MERLRLSRDTLEWVGDDGQGRIILIQPVLNSKQITYIQRDRWTESETDRQKAKRGSCYTSGRSTVL